ncbi:hypothetical protein AMTR_s00142p00051490 [Amborella trichopoda]|uniref:Uncharacterized protein n=1 Tax=Amborella trichopoda TaxID=13333 RepID=W1PDK1_AMBTC|nr:hypothetical protein AMTR_s00142p00051490 [Amborella trichopoda]
MAGKETGASKEPPPCPTITLPGRSSGEFFQRCHGLSQCLPWPESRLFQWEFWFFWREFWPGFSEYETGQAF